MLSASSHRDTRQGFVEDAINNGGFHKAKRLQVPANIIVLFQPPHCPELNPIEQLWQYLKRELR